MVFKNITHSPGKSRCDGQAKARCKSDDSSDIKVEAKVGSIEASFYGFIEFFNVMSDAYCRITNILKVQGVDVKVVKAFLMSTEVNRIVETELYIYLELLVAFDVDDA